MNISKINEIWNNNALNKQISMECPHCNHLVFLTSEYINLVLCIKNTYDTPPCLEFYLHHGMGYLNINFKCPQCNKHFGYFVISKDILINKGSVGNFFSPNDKFSRQISFESIESIVRINPREKAIAKIFPDYVPKQLITLYEEMCELFPINVKASILWSRKWLEKFIILYWKDIPKKQNSLNEKIKWLETEKKIQDHQLLDDLRFISNKGGHIESPTEEIIFTKNDSELCISIIEDLIEEYYIKPFEKNKRKEKLHALREATQNEADRIKKAK